MLDKSEKQKETVRNLKQENKELKQELRRKEKAPAEMAALLTLKKSERDLGGERGRLISPAERGNAMSLIQEALKEGTRLSPACATIGISLRTYQRWKAGNHSDRRKGAKKHIPRKLTAEERGEIRALCCDHEFKDENPYEIVITLLEKREGIISRASARFTAF